MNHATTCKFCHKPITLQIDDAYAELGDPYKLLSLAACNECADVRELRRLLEERIRKVAMMVAAMDRPKQEEKDLMRKNLLVLCEKYSRMIARWHRMEGMAFDAAVVDDILTRPDQWPVALRGLWGMFRMWKREQEERLL